jgi:LacI family transcriptional regulator
MIEHGVSGLPDLARLRRSEATFDRIARAGVPAMQVLRRVDPRTDAFPFAAPDYAEGGRLATRHLIEGGARRIAFAGGSRTGP